MYNTIVYNQRPYNSPVYNIGYKAVRFLRATYLISFSVTKKTLVFVRSVFKLRFVWFYNGEVL